MKLESINVSLPVTVEYNNKIISTGIFKKPTQDSIAVSHQGLAGDQQVDLTNHGGEHKAVYAFSAQHYHYWRKVLNRPDLCYGQFGENLTISELDESKLCIGDHLQIGECILEITQPRVPCFKLGMALERSDMPKLFVQHGATGIYFRVLHPGSINSGSKVELTYQQPRQLSVYSLFNAYFDKHFDGAKQIIQLATTVPALSQEWQQKINDRLA